jgi:uncharacterized protein
VKRFVHPLVLALTAILLVGYGYMAWRLATTAWQYVALAVPYALVWFVPVVYWGRTRENETRIEHLVHQASYLSMAWLSFVLVLTIVRDVLLVATLWSPALADTHALMQEAGPALVIGLSLAALLLGAASARRGPRLRTVDIPIAGLHAALEGFRIVQISDLHVARAIRRPYVANVVRLAQSLNPDLVALTGDMVDGPVARLEQDVEPLRELARAGRGYYVLGNHDCYAGPHAWIRHFASLGYHVLLNTHSTLEHGAARIVVAGVLDPAAPPGPRPDLATADAPQADLRLLLAHNPKSAIDAEREGFDLQLSGHTHAGQFFPWTLAVRLVHAPHVAGLSRQGRMWVYVSAGTGSWGPPVRFGTTPELTLLRLVRA